VGSSADTSFLVSLYTPDANSAEAQGCALEHGEIWLAPFGEFEFINAIQLRVFRKEITPHEADQSLRAFDDDTGTFLRRRAMPATAYEQAFLLARRHTRQTGVRSLDILHVAIALTLDAEVFLTFDRAQKRLARSAGLKVRP
jgi:predicted nucleic acid-binding protein